MKTTMKTGLAAFVLLLAISCTKESTTIQSTTASDESLSQALSPDGSELVGVHAVRIGTQRWKTANLDVGRYRNGDRIPYVKDPAKWAALTTGAWCWYNNDSATGHIYGKLYNWYAVNDPRGLAPEGWHIPSDSEWTTLTTFLGGVAVAGGKMKATGTIEAGTGLWYAPNTNATNRSGFTGIPGGYRANYGYSYNIGYDGYWWSSTEYDAGDAWICNLFSQDGMVYRSWGYKQNGVSVRCIKD